jgi:ribosomal protein L25 (general stress protein Ctc)
MQRVFKKCSLIPAVCFGISIEAQNITVAKNDTARISGEPMEEGNRRSIRFRP